MTSMKRTLAFTFGGLAAAALFAGLVHTAMVAAGVSEPAATTVYGMTSRRAWATGAGALALTGVVVGGFALGRSVRHIGNGGRGGAVVALVAGPIAAVNGGLVLGFATGGPGSGNGVVGGAGALVLGLIGMALGALALRRSRSVD